MPVSPVGGRPARLATIPVVLCVALYCWYRFTFFFPWGGFDPGFGPVEQASAAVVIASLGAVQLLFAFGRPARSRAGALLAVQVLLAYAPYPAFGVYWDPPAAFVLAAVLLTFGGRLGWASAALVVLGDAALRVPLEPGVVDADGGIVAVRLAYAGVVTAANGLLLFGVCRLSALVRDLDAARAAGASLEVALERLRIARRLQDAVGGRLVSGIAALRHPDADSGLGERSRAVAADARQALAQVRAVADDYRDRTLAGEAAAARTVLAAAGVEASVAAVPQRLPRPVDALLGAILRRTVVEALRGTPPRTCRVELDDSARMRVSFTGGGTRIPVPGEMAEEVRALGGRLRTAPGEVEVWLPAPARRPAGTGNPPPAAAAPWLAWGVMAVLEVDLLITTIARVTGGFDMYEPISTARVISAVALVVPLSLLQLHHVRPRSGAAPPGWRWTLTLQLVLVGALAVIGAPVVPAPQYAGPVAGVLLFHLRRPWSWALAGALIVGSTLFHLHRYGVDLTADPPHVAWWALVSMSWTVLAAAAVAALCRLPIAAEELVRARREQARLAVLRERLRIARDTHDLLGFQLSAIALKADLAGRAAAADPATARRQLAEAGRIAAEALNSLRSVTARPGGLSFADEVESARAMLAAAGTRVELELHAAPAPSAESPLAIVLRESVTNVVRHSRATRCQIETRPVAGGIRLRVANDGVPAGTPTAAAGNGLANLLARTRDTGGTLNVHREGDRFVLVAEIR
ncbi:two-component sensor histidine kinase [Virgisporangium aliadipatigenens]|uniref:Two-component sensor histidine kinase n=1 Tax=Virgisporangium aliadipatigenens TaxID=741659 RepID=A0A8J3YTI6_9ACTN|nr:histidine kinase [Virgisporangium aliadipatigenens]GIJ49650.1 two-component sensor histidine kinase [Virgisporangium aliadipatigenens]